MAPHGILSVSGKSWLDQAALGFYDKVSLESSPQSPGKFKQEKTLLLDSNLGVVGGGRGTFSIFPTIFLYF